MPQGFSRLGGGGDTLVTPAAILIVGIAIVLIFTLRRKYVAVPLLITAILIPLSQVVVIGGLHFMMLRILVLCAWLRFGIAIITKRSGGLRFNSIDYAVLVWGLISSITFWLLWGASAAALMNRFGFLWSTFGMYFLLRYLVRDPDDAGRVIKTLAVLAVVLAIFMSVEEFTGRNLFSMFGGVPEVDIVRSGKIRAQAAFLHAILAGTFGATLLPLFVGQFRSGQRGKRIVILGIVAAAIITYASGSSTPAMALLAGGAGLIAWPLRRHMRIVRWGVCVLLFALHLVMHAPVWALITRIDIAGGSSADHRFMLIDTTIRHFSDWWLLGTRDTSRWGWDMWDTSNYYVEHAVTGGLVSLIALLWLLSRCFSRIGTFVQRMRDDKRQAFLLWSLGAAMFAHAVGFMGVSYFDQTAVGWYALIAIISAATNVPDIPQTAEAPEPEPVVEAVYAYQ